MSRKKTVIYKGNQYDITNFIYQHPGGRQVIRQYLASNHNITEVFKAIHSPSAENTLIALPQLSKTEKNKQEKVYLKVEERINKLYKPSIPIEILLTTINITLYLLSIFLSHPLIAIFSFASTQILTAWLCHSQLHSHSRGLKMAAKIMGGAVMGLSADWWTKKHMSHHIFTNNQKLDHDIDHDYRTILYPLLLFKWRRESLYHCVRHLQLVDLISINIGYLCLLKQKLAYQIVGLLIASFYISVVVFGNHQRQLKYKRGYLDTFLTHQITTTTDYDFPSTLMLVLLGGFQYHTEHHLFPQVPFYRLGQAKRIIFEQLPSNAKEIKVSSIF